MANSKSLLSSTLVYAIGDLSSLIINFILVPLYTFYLTKEELGYYDIIITSASILLPLFTLHVELAIMRWLTSIKNKDEIDKVLSNGILILIIGLFIFSLLYFVSLLFIKIDNSILIFIYCIFFFVYPFLRQFSRGIGKTNYFVLASIGYSLLMLIFTFFLVIYLKLGIKGLLIANISSLSLVITYLFFVNKIFNHVNLKLVNIELIKDFIKYAGPLIPNTLNLWFMTISLRYLIVFYLGIENNGIYSVAYKFASIFQIINGIFYLAWQERAFQIYNNPIEQKVAYFENILKAYSILLITCSILFIAFQKTIIPIIVGKDFYSITDYMPILVVGFVFMCLGAFFGIIYQCERKTKGVSISAIISNIVVIVAGIVTIKSFKLMGISFAFALGYFTFFIIRLLDTRKMLHIRFPLLIFLVLSSIFILVYLLTKFEVLYQLLAMGIAIIVFLFFNWNIITKFSLFIKSNFLKL